ncbi:MAG TPA: M28 family peptidase [Methanobacteriaceae archaeon]|nr:M28 family peptidase [Methanobacteriaceae archaeon]
MNNTKISIFLTLIVLFSLFFVKVDCVSAQESLITHVQYITHEIGPRPAGSSAENQTAQYLASQFQKYGVKTEIQQFKYYSLNSENIKTSQNVIGTIKGVSDKEIIICADLDSPRDSLMGNYTSGANDDVASLAILIGLAKKYQNKKPFYTIKLVAFGAGEDSFTFPLITPQRTNLSPDAYYQIVYLPYLVGARQYMLTHQSSVNSTLAVISLEAVGIGTPCVVSRDYYAKNDPFLVNFLVWNGISQGIQTEKIDFMASNRTIGGESAISHVYLPFSIAGIPSTFITCMKNPNIHSPVHDVVNEMPGYLSVDDDYANLVKQNGDEKSLENHLQTVLYLVNDSIDKLSVWNVLNYQI